MREDHPPIPTATIPFAPMRPRSVPRPPVDLSEVEHAVADAIARSGAADPPAPAKPTDVQYVANSLDCLRHLDLKEAVIGMLGGKEMPKDLNEAIDRVAEWAAANKTAA